MNHGNICKDIEVKDIVTESPISHMMNLQMLLQHRLKKIPDIEASVFERVPLVIYWRHCIHTECDELLDWYKEENADFQELEMEVIDIMHFVFNIGIVLGLSSDRIHSILIDYINEYDVFLQRSSAIERLVCDLSGTLTKLIDLLPWKTWKKYDITLTVDIDELHYAFAQVVKANLEIASALSMNIGRVVSVYCAKNAENHARQDRSY